MQEKPEINALRSPEQIDRLLQIIHVPLWTALGFLMALITGILVWAFVARLPVLVSGMGILFDPASMYVIQTNLTGNIREILVNSEEHIEVGSPLFILENPLKQLELQEVEQQIALLERSTEQSDGEKEQLFALQMKQRALQESIRALTIRSPVQGVVLSLNAVRGELVQPDQILAWLREMAPGNEKITFYSFFAADAGALIQQGMQAHIAFKSIDSKLYGKMVGSVQKVIPFTGTTGGEISQSLPSQEWRSMLSGNKAVYTVIIDPKKDASTLSGYQWTSRVGPPFKVPLNALVDITVFLEKQRPIDYLIPLKFSSQ